MASVSSNRQASSSSAPTSKNTAGFTYPIFLVRCRQSLTAITNFINTKTNAAPNTTNVGLTRIWHGFDGKDNNLTLVVGYKEIYQMLADQGYGPDGDYRKHFKISPFDLRNYQYPASQDTNDLFVSIPPEIRKHGDSAIRISIELKLHHAAMWGIIPDKSWEITIPLTDRLDSTSVKGVAFINFHKNSLTVKDIAMVRVVLDDGIWQEFNPDHSIQDSKYPFKCYWAHKMRGDAEVKHATDQRSKKAGKKGPRVLTAAEQQGERQSRPMFAQNVNMVSLVSAVQPQLKDGTVVVPVVPFAPTVPVVPAPPVVLPNVPVAATSDETTIPAVIPTVPSAPIPIPASNTVDAINWSVPVVAVIPTAKPVFAAPVQAPTVPATAPSWGSGTTQVPINWASVPVTPVTAAHVPTPTAQDTTPGFFSGWSGAPLPPATAFPVLSTTQ